jgi:hypothetical protein
MAKVIVALDWLSMVNYEGDVIDRKRGIHVELTVGRRPERLDGKYVT